MSNTLRRKEFLIDKELVKELRNAKKAGLGSESTCVRRALRAYFARVKKCQ